jgi:hypothetical protein
MSESDPNPRFEKYFAVISGGLIMWTEPNVHSCFLHFFFLVNVPNKIPAQQRSGQWCWSLPLLHSVSTDIHVACLRCCFMISN